METVAGVFRSRENARKAAGELRSAGFSPRQINLLYPETPEEAIHRVPVSETEQPGVGAAIGGVVGAALGMAGGFALGVGLTALIPGVGPVVAVGVAGAALLGLGGLVGGAKVGSAGDEHGTEGVPSDEMFFYEDALRQGRSLVILLAHTEEEAHRAHAMLGAAGAESLDAAREEWWLGLRDAEAAHYRALGHNFERDQQAYRTGFESALRRECRAQSVEAAADCLKWWYPNLWDTAPFRRGFARGRAYLERRGAPADSAPFLAG
jgi:hypothetical protein